MQGSVRNFPAHQHSDNAFCNPDANGLDVFHCCSLHDCRPRQKSACPHRTCGLTTPREKNNDLPRGCAEPRYISREINKLFASRLQGGRAGPGDQGPQWACCLLGLLELLVV
eukprot:1223517-Prymnesium_polylepis.1